jgi:hypothetical protein
MRRTQYEQISSAIRPKADVSARCWKVREVPGPDSCSAANADYIVRRGPTLRPTPLTALEFRAEPDHTGLRAGNEQAAWAQIRGVLSPGKVYPLALMHWLLAFLYARSASISRHRACESNTEEAADCLKGFVTNPPHPQRIISVSRVLPNVRFVQRGIFIQRSHDIGGNVG